MLERDVIRKVIRVAKQLDIPYIRMSFMSGAAAGWPDYCFLLPGGKTLWIEFKATGKKPTALQTVRMAQLHALGFPVYVVDDPMEGVTLLRDIYAFASAKERGCNR